jgi:hypothetical protein
MDLTTISTTPTSDPTTRGPLGPLLMIDISALIRLIATSISIAP